MPIKCIPDSAVEVFFVQPTTGDLLAWKSAWDVVVKVAFCCVCLYPKDQLRFIRYLKASLSTLEVLLSFFSFLSLIFFLLLIFIPCFLTTNVYGNKYGTRIRSMLGLTWRVKLFWFAPRGSSRWTWCHFVAAYFLRQLHACAAPWGFSARKDALFLFLHYTFLERWLWGARN